MHSLFEFFLVNGEFGDPGLYAGVREERRALLFDLGDVSVLPPRRLLRLSHVFVSHAHMDHFFGFDLLLRVVLGRKDELVLVGGPGFVAQVEHKLMAYTWNVVHRYDVPLTLVVHECDPDGTLRCARFCSRTRFEREPGVERPASGDVLHDEPAFRVRGRFVDHDIPCLAYAIEEKAQVRVDKERLRALGVGTGPWLRELKRAVLGGVPGNMPIEVRWRDRQGEHEVRRCVDELRPLILDVAPGRRVGYVTDLRYTDHNIAVLESLVHGVDRLYIESVFLDEHASHGARKHHLTARQAGQIARRLGARAVVPFHFSPRYEGHADALRNEVQAAWASGPPPA